ncbi:MAG: maleylpyruvate isomerase family mycothiol-dependent enzyme [Acidimicrobiia bacterium]
MALDYPKVILEETAALAAAVEHGPRDAAVPGCPGWSLADLAYHLGDVQRWATEIVRTKERSDKGFERPADDEMAAFLVEGSKALVATLIATDPDAECFNFTGENQVVSFWPRRQALEAAVHRWDGDAAVAAGGDSPRLDPSIAVDVIDEFINVIIMRVVRREGVDLASIAGDVHVHCTDVEGEWTFAVDADGRLAVTAGHGKAAAAIRGTASDLALFLNNRLPADRIDRLERFGDTALIDRWITAIHF